MPRDAPVPPNVGLLELVFDCFGREMSVRHWLLFSGGAPADPSWSGELFFLAWTQCVAPYLSLMGDDTYSRAGRLTLSGQRYESQFPGERGSRLDTAPLSTTLCFHWQALDPSYSRRTITHVPGVSLGLLAEHQHVSAAHVPDLVEAGNRILNGLRELPDPVAGTAVPVAVRRRTKDGPLDHALVSPLFAVVPSWTVSSLRRRLPKRGPVSPPVTG